MTNRQPQEPRPPEVEARRVLAAMLVLTVLIVIVVALVDALGTTGRSVVLIAWIAVWMAVLRRYS